MALTRNFKETVKARAERDSDFRIGLLQEALEAFVAGDAATGRIMLRDYVNASIGFDALGKQLGRNPKSLMRMLSVDGNPRADNLFAIIAHLEARERVSFSLTRTEPA